MTRLAPIAAALASVTAVRAAAQFNVAGGPAALAYGQPLDGFVSYSIEFSSFPDFAGNNSHPNTFSNTLLENIGNIIGTKPYIRVGGNTQDYALYNASLDVALFGIVNPNRSADYPTTIHIGPSYFESYNTWNATKFSHGFNMGLGGNNSAGWQTLLDTVPLACKALSGGKLYTFEYGNEADLFSTSAQGAVRPANWTEKTYVAQWQNATAQIKALVQQNCPDLASNGYGYLAPSFAGTNNKLKAPLAWKDGLDSNKDIKLFSTHNYISGATSPGVTLQGTLMNHTTTKKSVDSHITEYKNITSQDASAPPLIMGETNSLYNQGKPGLSNSFGAALWGVDFNLYCASVGIRRVHMHMGTNYRYASWQPIETNITTIGTKTPYYGNIAVAAALGNLTQTPVSVAEVPGSSERLVAYAIYSGQDLLRVLVLNLNQYNSTVDGGGEVALDNPPPRGNQSFTIELPTAGASGVASVSVQRLLANGSDAVTGVTWDGWSYNYELAQGKPVRLANVTVGETVAVGGNGTVVVTVPDSSAALLSLVRPGGGGNGTSPTTSSTAGATTTTLGPTTVPTSGALRRMNILGYRV